MKASGAVSLAGWRRDDRRNVRLYDALAEKYGVDARALDWSGRRSQERRFAVLATVGPLEGARVLDVGCGQGDLFGWLRRRGVRLHYPGIDLAPRMIEIAGRRYPEAEFRVAGPEGIDGRYDYVLASGVFAHRRFRPRDYLEAVVWRMFERCTRAVGFNSLSAWADRRAGREFHADPVETMKFARTLSSRVVLRHDYHPRDFTVFLYRGPRP
jgi:SAM-dependent methyltransferase